jgi:competence protein ComEC
MVQAPLFQVGLAFSTGILAAQLFAIPHFIVIAGCALTSVLAVVFLLKHKLTLTAFSLAGALVSSGFWLAQSNAQNISSNSVRKLIDDKKLDPRELVDLTGVVDGPVDVARDAYHFTLKIERLTVKGIEQRAEGLVEIVAGIESADSTARYEQLELIHGTRLRVKTKLRRTDSFRNPGVQAFTEYLDRKGLDATSFVKNPALIERLDEESSVVPLSWLYRSRASLQKEIDAYFSAETAGVLDAALLGNRHNLLPDTTERFRVGGTFHVVVISGLHISFIGAVVLLITRRLTKSRGWQFSCSVVVLWAYTLAVGAEASVVRSALMFTMVALARVIFRRASTLNALGGAALFLLMWQPQNLFDPSFQLTFLSVLAIVIVALPLMEKLKAIGSWRPTYDSPYPPACARWLRNLSECLYWSEREWKVEIAESVYRYKLRKSRAAPLLERFWIQRACRYSFNALVVSLSVQLLLLPFLVIYFHRLSLASIVLNIGVSLMMAVLAIVTLVALLVLTVNLSAALPLFALANGVNWLMVHSVDPFARFGVASFRLPHYSGKAAFIYVIYYVPLIILTTALARWNPLAFPAAKRSTAGSSFMIVSQILLIAVVVLHPMSAYRPDGRLRVDFLDVGQGDSALVTMPDGTTLLIDGGGRPNFSRVQPDNGAPARVPRSIGETVVSEYLWWRGLDSVDYILATHADADHIDGLNDVAMNFKVRAALVARTPQADAEFRRFEETLKSRAIPMTALSRGDVLQFGEVTATVLWPPASNDAAAPSGNNDSVVLRLQFGKHAILLTGDIESAAERAIVNHVQQRPTDVVKVAHHGSKTSSIQSFIDATHPQFAIISVGQVSVFGHPHSEVVKRWKSSGARVMTTGHSGMITVTTDGKDLSVEEYANDQ